MATLEELVEDHKRCTLLTEEEAEAIWRKIVESTDGLAEKLVFIRRRSFDELHGEVLTPSALARASANDRPTIFDRIAAWWRRMTR